MDLSSDVLGVIMSRIDLCFVVISGQSIRCHLSLDAQERQRIQQSPRKITSSHDDVPVFLHVVLVLTNRSNRQ